MTPLALMTRCASAFAGPLDPNAAIEAMVDVSRIVEEENASRVAKGVVKALIAFARCLVTEAARDPHAMREQVKKLIAVRVHFLATHTFLLDYVLRLESHSMLSPESLVVYVHDVSCAIHLPSTDLIARLDVILDALLRVQTLAVIGSECCFLGALLHDCPNSLCREQLARVLHNMFGRCRDVYDAREEFSLVLFFMKHPKVVSSFQFHLMTRRALCVLARDVLEGPRRVDEADRKKALRLLLEHKLLGDVSAALIKYMAVGPYETNLLFLELGETLQEVPYLPLVEAFLTSSPKYPFPQATWDVIDTMQDVPAARRCLEHRLLVAKNAKGNVVSIEDLAPGEWFCRVVES